MVALRKYEYIKEINGVVLPDSWALSKIKYIGKYLNGFAFKPVHWSDEGVSIIRIQNLTNQEADINRTSFIAPDRYRIFEGDILISWSATLDVFIWQREEVWLNQHIYRVEVNEIKILKQYFYWAAKWFMKELNESSHGSTMQHLTTDKFGGFIVPLPPKSEQRLIANFLNYEASQIDTLIDKQQQLIQLLKEKRQAVISHAVTKGLNPNAPMRDSGVEWLGEVPEHWEVKRLRYLGTCQNGINIGAEYFGSGFPFVSYGDAYKNEVLPEYGSGLVESTEQDRVSYSVNVGDVIFTRTSETVEEIGLSSVCLKAIKDATFAGFLIRFRPNTGELYPDFSKYYFRNTLMRTFFIKEMNLVTRASLSQDLLKKLPVPLPPMSEQIKIAEMLDKKSATFEKLIENAEAAIELMKERRTALISAAVTGKIDVRHPVCHPTGDLQSSKSTVHGDL